MDSFDLILIVTGALLILVGLGLFIFGKKDGNKNYLEGFGIKLDVSNPSIILIVAGVGLLLAPRLLPANKPAMGDTSSPLQHIVTEPQQQQSEFVTEKSTGQDNTGKEPPKQQPRHFMPQGYWQLNDYQESGVALPNVQGSISFANDSEQKRSWQANLIFMDMWGNMASYSYQGQIWVDPEGRYFISLLASNDPGFIAQPRAPLELMMEQGNMLHLAYSYRGTDILMHFMQ
ncbi:hypothetical protein [Lacimicrobium alkaliphilum]|uniref:Uncharacterized protein n=1 Tax=Lacimicrobium alkaliphilum TaxID=1526571 RepID=A0A0U3B6N2_9ALTE|nr:hypothetical protein [Lacimicrobium alkaliphilum]ALS97301.1 hypothetical protein AT746_02780 [Lacimicrobium alkaliphilum]